MAFLENPNNLPEVHHKDANKENNRLDNLQWVTRSDNQLLTIRDCPNRIGEGHYLSRLNEQAVREIRGRRGRGESLSEIAKDYGVSINTISAVAQRKTWKHVE
ncbi:HNH endonuclease [Sphingopyxis sp. 113P3]|uniref:HNH endonuclease n=1 Tax=Sphingopyxis sp. (strain 113P3) TaxID=292913 RepID=UPI00190FFABC